VGYATGIFGKWHMGKEGQYHPSQRGFDEAIVSDNGHFNFETTPKTDVPKGTYFADFIADPSESGLRFQMGKETGQRNALEFDLRRDDSEHR
jgi:arylsulfatase A-like enzyme